MRWTSVLTVSIGDDEATWMDVWSTPSSEETGARGGTDVPLSSSPPVGLEEASGVDEARTPVVLVVIS